jgi:hypothetical protein
MGQMKPNFFMGPTLYDSRISYINSKQQTCAGGDTCFLVHIDMLHESPLYAAIRTVVLRRHRGERVLTPAMRRRVRRRRAAGAWASRTTAARPQP